MLSSDRVQSRDKASRPAEEEEEEEEEVWLDVRSFLLPWRSLQRVEDVQQDASFKTLQVHQSANAAAAAASRRQEAGGRRQEASIERTGGSPQATKLHRNYLRTRFKVPTEPDKPTCYTLFTETGAKGPKHDAGN